MNQEFYIWPLPKLILLLGASSDCIVKVIEPLYGIPKVGNHWFATYYTHYKEKLGIKKSTYDPCIFYRSGPFGIMGIQTNDTLILANNNFASKEKAETKAVKIMMKD